MIDQVWKDVEGYEGLYKVSNYSNVFSLTARRTITPTKKSDLYLHFKLYKNGKARMHYAHRLSAKAFIPNPYDKSFVNHKDGNKLNNYIGNFEWVTASENTIHSFRMGLQISLKDGNHPRAKKVINKLTGDSFNSIKEAARHSCSKYPAFLSQVTGRTKTNKTNFTLA